ncbi:MAG: hypothetical protein QOE92_959, partial [Chloroflexota bacterium]|nr:hypothetical protein [Chloroflexota bacterium]
MNTAVTLPSPESRLDEIADEVRGQRPLPAADPSVLAAYADIAEAAAGPAGWDEVAEIVVAAELVDRGFRLHRLREDADCRRDELLLGDYCLVCAAELATRLGRSDVELEFSTAATTASVGDDYGPALRR